MGSVDVNFAVSIEHVMFIYTESIGGGCDMDIGFIAV